MLEKSLFLVIALFRKKNWAVKKTAATKLEKSLFLVVAQFWKKNWQFAHMSGDFSNFVNTFSSQQNFGLDSTLFPDVEIILK